MKIAVYSLTLVLALLCAPRADAQNWSFDARKIALGSPSGGDNVASQMIEDAGGYRSIVVPLGLIQVFRDFRRLNPSNEEFDLVRSIELVAAPIHYTIGRDRSDSRADDFITDLGNGELSSDLNDYKGFVPVNQAPAGGVAAPSWGKTFKVRQGADGAFHGLYVGAGPYVAMRTAPVFDDRLVPMLRRGERVYHRNAALTASNTTQAQLATSIVGGYRGRFAWPASPAGITNRDGLYVAANYRYLRGFRYEDIDFRVRMDTDDAGLLRVNPALPSPLEVTRLNARRGTGMAMDFGIGAVLGSWEFGVGANGVANRLDWSGVQGTTYSLDDLSRGDGDLLESGPFPRHTVRVSLPVEYRANAAYDAERWMVVGELGRGLQGPSFRGGGEFRLGRIDLLSGAIYSRGLWNPTGGIGVALSERAFVDVAVYSNSANIERKRQPAVAISLRFQR